jgi:HEPN domain-containing protein
LVESKVEVLLRVSEVNLARAKKRFDAGEYDTAVFHASMAVESIANAMIIKLGGNEAKDHRAISGLAAVLRIVKPELLKENEQIIDKGRNIQREVVYTRYPLKIQGKWVTPEEYYTQEKAMAVIGDAQFIVDGIRKQLITAKS